MIFNGIALILISESVNRNQAASQDIALLQAQVNQLAASGENVDRISARPVNLLAASDDFVDEFSKRLAQVEAKTEALEGRAISRD